MRILAAALAACLLAAAAANAQMPHPYERLPGTIWSMTEWNGTAPKREPRARLSFSYGHVGEFAISAGCNVLTGRYTVDGERVKIEMLGSTKMMCPPERMENDRRLSGDLKRVIRFAMFAEGTLVAYAADGAVIFRFGRAPRDQ